MERYYQRRVDCRRNAGGSGCGQNFNPGPAPRMDASCGCQNSSAGNRSDTNTRSGCSCQAVSRAGFNVCRPGENPPAANADVAMGFVPWQQWECTYPLNKGLSIGTVFPSLDKPFTIGRCAVRP